MEWTDKRPLEEITFAIDAPIEERAERSLKVRGLLKKAGLVVADDIDETGCTGLVAGGLHIAEAQFVRANIGGLGHALPCFVGMDRFCLVHEVIGGLQAGQAIRFPERAQEISRPLSAEEKANIDIIERARRVEDDDPAKKALKARDILMRREPLEPHPVFVPAQPVWKCVEHSETVWSCRFCLGAELVRGALEPKLLIFPTVLDNTNTADNVESLAPEDVDAKIDFFDKEGAQVVAIYAQVVRLERKLAR